jgi:hypothetical protein
MKLDYSPLHQPVTQTDIATFKAATRKPKNNVVGIVVLSVLGSIAFVFILMAIISNPGSPIGLVAAAIIGLIVLVAVIATRAQLKRRAKLYKFAAANGLRLLCDVADPGYAGMIFDEGDSRRINEALLFADGTEIGNYQYSTGSGKNRHTHYWSYVRIKLARRLPNMVLDARKNNLFGNFTNLPDSFSRNQTLSLEGDFNNYFTLYAPKEYERDALYVFTPDVMAAVIDVGQTYDMEVVDDNLMLYSTDRGVLSSEDRLNTLLAIIEKIGTELRDQSDYYTDERTGDRAANIVAEPGRRLKNSVSIPTIIAVVLVIIYHIINAYVYR